ncbi:amidohydrolase family protein [Pseudarthrobacter phenanthrenivorans]|uniref:amidohydrolase family protein n=1 Tax=Pseudarthrobacter phenanthrenivorans TaxID=361575 RepID=UPI002F35FE44
MHNTIDAHHHFWTAAPPGHPRQSAVHTVLDQNYGPEDLIGKMQSAGVDGTVLIQSRNEASENDRLSAYATYDFVRGVVAWLPLDHPEAAYRELDRLDPSKLCGVRHLVADDPLDWANRASSISLFRDIARRGLAWDIVAVTPMQVVNVLKLAAAVPELMIVIDHLARPPLGSKGREPWARQIKDLAQCPTIAVKVSVGINSLLEWPTWTNNELLPYIDWACLHFGPTRLMLASNWPVVLLRANYDAAWNGLVSTICQLLPAQQDQNFLRGETAQNWYHLHP